MDSFPFFSMGRSNQASQHSRSPKMKGQRKSQGTVLLAIPIVRSLWAKKGLALGQGADERLPWPLNRDWPRPIVWPEQMRMQAKRGAQRKLLVFSTVWVGPPACQERPVGPVPEKSLDGPWQVPWNPDGPYQLGYLLQGLTFFPSQRAIHIFHTGYSSEK